MGFGGIESGFTDISISGGGGGGFGSGSGFGFECSKMCENTRAI